MTMYVGRGGGYRQYRAQKDDGVCISRVYVLRYCFFFSSRRRHTRFDCDWSSDVCSSDLKTFFSPSCESLSSVLPQPLRLRNSTSLIFPWTWIFLTPRASRTTAPSRVTRI